MLVVGLTGGIGSGKSTVSALLEERGAVVVDADRIAREVVAPGGPAYQPVVDRFGPGVVTADGAIDRPALAAVVFADPSARADLEAITHPVVGAAMAERLTAQAGTDHVVVLDVPLLVEGGRRRSGGEASGQRRDLPHGVAAVVVVDTPPEVAVSRLVRDRGMKAAEIEARMAAQATREDRLALADVVIDNSGSTEDLVGEVDRAWDWIEDLRRRKGRPGPE
ncbi:MAG TPA: dephospho-CoA kinase [Acidimicrobiales bacterium]|nr:dephospho-CoA kinase [Acidimicrobiales bacterium]